MNYYIIAGEASGDLHASNLMKAIREQDPQAKFRCWGGDLMQEQGGEIVKHYRDLAFMGFLEVIKNLGTILDNIKFCKEDILQWNPDVLIFIDYPGFNLRIAKFAREKGFKTVYYISPQVWAWKESRVKAIKRDVDKMLVILPFEKEFYDKYNMPVDFVGHPLLDALDSQLLGAKSTTNGDEKPLIALLPGSRKQEIEVMLPEMLKVVPHFPDYRFVIAGAPSQGAAMYQSFTGGTDVQVVFGETYTLLAKAKAALVTSGTATLETALIGTPEVVLYKGNAVSFQIARRLVKVKFISLVNLIMDREVVRELIQQDMHAEQIIIELKKLLEEHSRKKLLEEYADLRKKLGGPGASARAARIIVQFLQK